MRIPNTYESIKEKILREKIVDENDCWTGVGFIISGYPFVKFQGKRKRLTRIVAHIFLNFDENSEYQINHKCDNSKCINPDHFMIGDQLQNVRDMDSKGRRVRSSHKLTHENRERIIELRKQNVSINELSKIFGVHRFSIKQVIENEKRY